MSGNPYAYAGWFVVDARLLGFILLFSLFLTVGTLAIFARDKTRKQLVSIGAGLYAVTVIVTVLLLNGILRYPVFRIESFFPFP